MLLCQGTRTCSREGEQPRLGHGWKRKRSVWLISGNLVSNGASWSPVDLQVRMGVAWLIGTASQNGARQAIFPQCQQHSSPHREQQLEKGCWTRQQGLGGSTALQRWLACASGTNAHMTWLPVSKCFWAVYGVRSKPFEGKQGEAALPAQTRAITVAWFFSIDLINAKNKQFLSLGTVSWS